MRFFLFLLVTVLLLKVTVAQDSSKPVEILRERREQLQIALRHTVDTKPLQNPMSLAKALKLIEGQVAKTEDFTLRLEEGVFGSKQKAILEAEVAFPRVPDKVTLLTAIRLSVSHVVDLAPLEVGFRPTGIGITRPTHATYTMQYDVREVRNLMPPRGKEATPPLRRWASMCRPLVTTSKAPRRTRVRNC